MGLQTPVKQTAFPIVWMPETIEEAWEMKKKTVGAVFVAGGTVIQMRREQGVSQATHLISLTNIEQLKMINDGDTLLEIGSLCVLSDCLKASAIKAEVPLLIKAIASIAAPAVRNRGTIGGNVTYRQGDAIPVMVALDADAVIYSDNGYECISVAEYVENLEPSILLAVRFRKEKPTKAKFIYEKVGRREAFTLSLLTIACVVELDGAVLKQIKLAIGGGDMIPQRLTEIENVLTGAPLTEELLTVAYSRFKKAGVICTTPFATEEYVRTVLANIVVSSLEEFMKEEVRYGKD
ncbi:FAD binding domain-containing protein [Shouchella patagoniensis]|uniref:FAD binding domain-containing protein n=1 Tax=Shouchella patagoniensis TaxID=228576 RepID=UPI00111775DE|nr:FAD binding domain-containing protein [Shouchella patagoniensis]